MFACYVTTTSWFTEWTYNKQTIPNRTVTVVSGIIDEMDQSQGGVRHKESITWFWPTWWTWIQGSTQTCHMSEISELDTDFKAEVIRAHWVEENRKLQWKCVCNL